MKKSGPDKIFVCCGSGNGEIIEKKSRFIAAVSPAYTQADAEYFIEGIKRKYRDARHNCYAYITDEGRICRFSDDGEPAKTAGAPIYNLIASGNIVNVCVTVTRYFGGILLGTGGLIRAYTDAAVKAIKSSTILERHEGFMFKIESDYDYFGKMQHTALNQGIYIYDVEYTENITVTFIAEASKKQAFIDRLANESSGRIRVILDEKKFFVEKGGSAAELYPLYRGET